MGKPILLVIAGCNGSGKSSFSKALSPQNIVPFDYDKVYLKKYNSLIDSELRELMAHTVSREELESSIRKAISHKDDFCYETNFNSTPLFWPEKFKSSNYRLELVFFCLDSIEKAKERVRIRVENGGHYVPDHEIENRYNLGFKHLDQYWRFFDSIHLFDTSAYNKIPEHILTIEGNNIVQSNEIPNFLKNKIPDVLTSISN